MFDTASKETPIVLEGPVNGQPSATVSGTDEDKVIVTMTIGDPRVSAVLAAVVVKKKKSLENNESQKPVVAGREKGVAVANGGFTSNSNGVLQGFGAGLRREEENFHERKRGITEPDYGVQWTPPLEVFTGIEARVKTQVYDFIGLAMKREADREGGINGLLLKGKRTSSSKVPSKIGVKITNPAKRITLLYLAFDVNGRRDVGDDIAPPFSVKGNYLRKGVSIAIKDINDRIFLALVGLDQTLQYQNDQVMIDFDKTENKGELGGNATLAVSIASCKAGASVKEVPLYNDIADLFGKDGGFAVIISTFTESLDLVKEVIERTGDSEGIKIAIDVPATDFCKVFKTRTPKTKVISTSLEGISPRVGFPAVSIELNITVNLEIHVSNPNHASFKHGEGRSVILYRDKQVGNVIIAPGKIPSMGGETIMCRLTLEADKFVGSDLSGFIKDVLGGDIAVDTKTKIPGRVNFLGIFKRDAVATSDCHIVIGVPDMKIKWQECSQKTKL
ncbi:hypothetical protein GIB67_041986 [Kingdonia uniflora]|uniref:phosphopyruvate hydratase n=1 Tax=Kingdonia uniflora TaxID=39325 RepID=A0A7J7NZZ0_9MAGN|nr:hypothetical protein GIB67_041986 [Kingdonia uniflora]